MRTFDEAFSLLFKQCFYFIRITVLPSDSTYCVSVLMWQYYWDSFIFIETFYLGFQKFFCMWYTLNNGSAWGLVSQFL